MLLSVSKQVYKIDQGIPSRLVGFGLYRGCFSHWQWLSCLLFLLESPMGQIGRPDTRCARYAPS